MLIFIENTPRAYAWGSRDALPELLGTVPTGEPQAELWLGAHPGAPASVAKATLKHQSLIELIESDPERYGVCGGQLPFLLKLLAIGGPLSLQVHPDKEQAEAGFAREEAAGVPREATERNYGDPNHKPELLVALSEVTALSGFRPLADARRELRALAAAAPAGERADALAHAVALLEGAGGGVAGSGAPRAGSAAGTSDDERARAALLEWALSGAPGPVAAAESISAAVHERAEALPSERLDPLRLEVLRELTDAYPGDPGVLVSLLLHLVRLEPGEAIYLGARQLHAYLKGLAVEVMAASDNVLRAGFTSKHIDAVELMRIVDTAELAEPRFSPRRLTPGLVAWEPGVIDFRLMRASLRDQSDADEVDTEMHLSASERGETADAVRVDVPHPLVLVVTSGRVRVERLDVDLSEVASVGRGQSLYVSAGEDIELSGAGDVFMATVGRNWPAATTQGVSSSFN